MSGPTITLEDLLACLGEQEHAEGYKSAAEWAAALDVSADRMSRLMHQAADKGRLLVRREVRTSIDGRAVRVPVYSFTLN